MKHLLLPITLFTFALLAACSAAGGVQTSGQSPAAQALETYLKALAERDENRMTQLVCSDWESQALLEYDSFGGVKTSLEGVSCVQTDTDGNATLVNCEGKIHATYSNETQDFDLSQRTYRLVQQGSDWQVCGYSPQ